VVAPTVLGYRTGTSLTRASNGVTPAAYHSGWDGCQTMTLLWPDVACTNPQGDREANNYGLINHTAVIHCLDPWLQL